MRRIPDRLRRTADPPQPVAHADGDAQRAAEPYQQQLIHQTKEDPHVEIDAPAGELRHQREVGEPGAIHHLHRGAIDRHRVHLRRPAAVDLIYRPGTFLRNRRTDLQPAGVQPRLTGHRQHQVKLRWLQH